MISLEFASFADVDHVYYVVADALEENWPILKLLGRLPKKMHKLFVSRPDTFLNREF